MHTATCKVYVTIADGVYRIQNNYSKLYMSTSDRASSLANVYQETADSGSETGLRQMWRIKYLADGYYSIRPMHNLSTALSVYNNDAYVNTASTTDVLSAFPLSAWWKIGMFESFTYFYPASGAATALMLASDTTATGANITVSANDPSAARQQWMLSKVASPPSGVRWYDNIGNPLTGSTGNPEDASIEKYMTVGQTKTLTELKLAPVFYSTTNINQQFVWSVFDPVDETVNTNRVATVNASTGAVTAVGSGVVLIRGCKVLNSREYWVTFALHVSTAIETDWPDAFIRNAESIKYVDIENQTMANNTAIHQWQFHGGKTQRWKLERDADGYYTIRSLNSGSTSYYLGIAGTSVILTSSGSLNSSKWKIGFGGKKGVKLIPKTRESEDYVLALQTSNTNNGTKLVIQPHTYDDDFSDEWMLPGKVDYSLVYIGVSDGDTNMPPCLNTNENALRASGRYGNGVTAAEKHEMLEYLALSNVFSCITHGNVTCIRLTNDVIFDTTDITPLASDAFADLDIVCLGACYTGRGEENAANLVNAIHSKGAKVVIGFTTGVIVSETERWVAGFTTAIAQGKTVEEAISAGDAAAAEERKRLGKATTTDEFRYVVGDTNFIPCP